nr:MAG: hypothetical protein DIU57_18830 [Pseudomonadota bacterium]
METGHLLDLPGRRAVRVPRLAWRTSAEWRIFGLALAHAVVVAALLAVVKVLSASTVGSATRFCSGGMRPSA